MDGSGMVGRPVKATSGQIADALAQMDGTRSAGEIARMSGVSRGYVYELARLHGRPLRLRQRRVPVAAPHEVDLRIDRLIALTCLSDDVIAEVIGVTRAVVRHRRHGLQMPAGRARMTQRLDWLLLPCGVEDWLQSQVPAGGQLADVLRAIVIDAYADEVGQ